MLHETRTALCFRAKNYALTDYPKFCIGFPVVRTDGRSVGHVITKFSGMGRFIYPGTLTGQETGENVEKQRETGKTGRNKGKQVKT